MMKKLVALLMALALLCTSIGVFAEEEIVVVPEEAEVVETETAETGDDEETLPPPSDGTAEEECKHTYTDADEIKADYKAATCTEAGQRVYKCQHCQKPVVVPIKAKGHEDKDVPVTKEIKAADCKTGEKGILGHYACKNCDVKYWETDILPKHSYTSKTIDATCTSNKKIVETCTVCGFEQTTEIKDSMKPHTWCYGTGTEDDECDHEHFATLPTCTEKGTAGTVKICSVCGAKENLDSVKEIEVLNHQKLLEDGAKNPYVTFERDEKTKEIKPETIKVKDTVAEGTKTYDAYKTTEGTYGKVEITYRPSVCKDQANGVISIRCLEEGCGAHIEIALPIVAHKYETEYAAGADCTKQTYKLYVCSVCGDTYKEALPVQADHKFVEGENVVGYWQQTERDSEKVTSKNKDDMKKCYEYYETVQCQNEGCSKTKDFKKAADETKHVAATYIIDEKATCYSIGEKMYNCEACGKYVTENSKMLEHEYEIFKTVTEPTCTSTGLRVLYCKNCCKIKTEKDGTKTVVAVAPNTVVVTKEEVIPALTHCWKYTDTRDKASCVPGKEKVGIYSRYCPLCDTTEVLDVKAGHQAPALGSDKYISHYPVSCTEDGVDVFYCTVCCNKVTVTTPKLGHTYEKDDYKHTCITTGKNACVAPTCKTGAVSGWIHKDVCTRPGCGKVRSTEDVTTRPEGHTMFKKDGTLNSFTIVERPSCQKAGSANYVCFVCKETIKNVELPAFPHNYAVTKDKNGVYEFTCKKIARTATGKTAFIKLLTDAGYDAKVATAVVEDLYKGSGANFTNIGCEGHKEITVKRAVYDITIKGSDATIKLQDEAAMTKLEKAYLRVTWRYTTESGETVGVTNTIAADEDGVYYIDDPDVYGHRDFMLVEVVSNRTAHRLDFKEYDVYGSKKIAD